MPTNTTTVLYDGLAQAIQDMQAAGAAYIEAARAFLEGTGEEPRAHHYELEGTTRRLVRDAADLRRLAEECRIYLAQHGRPMSEEA